GQGARRSGRPDLPVSYCRSQASPGSVHRAHVASAIKMVGARPSERSAATADAKPATARAASDGGLSSPPCTLLAFGVQPGIPTFCRDNASVLFLLVAIRRQFGDGINSSLGFVRIAARRCSSAGFLLSRESAGQG